MRNKRTETNWIVLHTSLTFPDQEVDAKDITQWHLRRGWIACGYQFIILRNGTVETGCPMQEMGAHVKGHNSDSVGICIVGGLEHLPAEESTLNRDRLYVVDGKPRGVLTENATAEQWVALHHTVGYLKALHPSAVVVGHRDLAKDGRHCPGFSASKWWQVAKDTTEGEPNNHA